jgi:ribosomal protein S18 acetylase RimI-like enzyme
MGAVRATLGAAFESDPVWQYCIGTGRNMAARCGWLMGIGAAESVRRGTVWMSPDGSSVAVWNAPSHRFGAAAWRDAATAPIALWAAGRYARRGLRVGAAIRRAHPQSPPHWYLAMLGTHPAHQGRGLASALLEPVLDQCDDEGLPAYLESSKESNIPFYERHGFRVEGAIDLPPGCPPIWPMWRDPR